MKVIILINDYSIGAGTERAVHNLGDLLTRNLGNKVEIFSLFKSSARAFYTDSPDIKVRWLQLEHRFRPLLYFRFFMDMLHALGKKESCVVLGTSHGHSLMLPLIRVFRPRNRYFACEHVILHSVPKLTRLIIGMSYRFLDGVIVLTQGERASFEGFVKDVRVVPNSISFEPRLTEKRGKILLAVGRLTHLKGFDLLLLCFRDFSATHPDWRLRIVGDGEDKEMLRRMIADLHLEPGVTLVPPVERIESEYENASMLLMTSRNEAYPMVLLEGMAFSLPVIAFDCPVGPSELIEDGANGYLVPMGDIKGYVERMSRVARDAELRARMGEDNLRRLAQFSGEKISAKWKDILGS